MSSTQQQKQLTLSPEITLIKLRGQVIILEMHCLHVLLFKLSILFHLPPGTSQCPLFVAICSLSRSSVFELVQLNQELRKTFHCHDNHGYTGYINH